MSNLQILGIVATFDIVVTIIVFMLLKKFAISTYYRFLIAVNAATLCNIIILLVRAIFLAVK